MAGFSLCENPAILNHVFPSSSALVTYGREGI